MSGYIDDEELEGSELVKDLRKQLKAKAKEADDARAEAKKAHGELSGFKVRDVLTERGITDKRITKFLTRDVEDLSDSQAVDEWLTENGDLFGYKPEKPAQNQETGEALRQINEAEGAGISDNEQANILAKITGAESADELDALRAKLSHLKA